MWFLLLPSASGHLHTLSPVCILSSTLFLREILADDLPTYIGSSTPSPIYFSFMPLATICNFIISVISNDSIPLEHELHNETDHKLFYSSLYFSVKYSKWQKVGAQQMLAEWIHLLNGLTEQKRKTWMVTSKSGFYRPGFMQYPVASSYNPLFLTCFGLFSLLPPKPLTLTHRLMPSSKPGGSTCL